MTPSDSEASTTEIAGGGTPCPNPECGAEVPPDAIYCEDCGAELSPTSAAPDVADGGEELPITLSTSIRAEQPATEVAPPRPCQECGGEVGPDGYCMTCGTKAPRERDHYNEQPAPWVAAVSDRGIRHHRNEDAMATHADAEPGSRAVLVVCDGVSSSEDSDVASLAAARAARDVLAAYRPAGMGTPASRVAALAQALEAAAVQANAAVIDRTAEDSVNSPSCTFTGAIVEGDLIMVGNIGDSRAYWIPDQNGADQNGADSNTAAEPRLLTVDDSVAQVRIAAGVPREEAENGPQAHAITKWLGRDSPDIMPGTTEFTITGSGWVLVCSDGLWNYASEPADLQQLITELLTTDGASTEPLPLAEALVGWACEQGGRDNITVALARYES